MKAKIEITLQHASCKGKSSSRMSRQKKEPEPAPQSNPQLVDAILKAIAASKTAEELDEAGDLIRELKDTEDKARCQESLEKKRNVK